MSVAPPPSGPLRLLAARRFGPLFLTQLLGAFNDNVFKQALIILITFVLAHGRGNESAMLVTLAAGIFILPFFVFSALAGQIADRFEKSGLIRRIKSAEIAIMGTGALGFWLESLPLLLVVLFLMGAQSAFFGPLKYAILPQHLATAELTAGNGLIQMATYLAILTGTMLGGFLMAEPGRGVLLTSSAVVVIAAAGYVASRFIPRAPATARAGAVDWNLVRLTARVMRHARAGPGVLAAIVGISWFWFLGATYLQLLPTYGRDVLGGDARVVTLLLTAFSLGIGAGALACHRLARGRGPLALVPWSGAGLALLGLGPWLLEAFGPTLGGAAPGRGPLEVLADPAAWPLLACFLGLATCGGLFVVPLYVHVQVRSPEERRARVIAANNVLNSAFMVVSALATMALLAAGASLAGIFALAALATAAFTAGVWRALAGERRGGALAPERG